MPRASKRAELTCIPAWLKALPGHVRLSRLEVAKALGYANTRSLMSSLYRGVWPELETIERREFSGFFDKDLPRSPRAHYKAFELRNLIRKVLRENTL